jgi:hypothetical protein
MPPPPNANRAENVARAVPDPYLVAWEDLRRRRVAAVVAFVAWAPLTGCAVSIVQSCTHSRQTSVWVYLACAPFVVLTMVCLARKTLFICPHCGNLFHLRGLVLGLVSKGMSPDKCANCGIRKGMPRDGWDQS